MIHRRAYMTAKGRQTATARAALRQRLFAVVARHEDGTVRRPTLIVMCSHRHFAARSISERTRASAADMPQSAPVVTATTAASDTGAVLAIRLPHRLETPERVAVVALAHEEAREGRLERTPAHRVP